MEVKKKHLDIERELRFVDLCWKKNNKYFKKKMAFKVRNYIKWFSNSYLKNSHSENMSINRVPIKDEYNLLFEIRDKDFVFLFFNIEDLLIDMYYN